MTSPPARSFPRSSENSSIIESCNCGRTRHV
jgi:hypothetical protein